MPAKHIETDDFEKEVLQSSKAILVDFYAEWCGPCKIQGPIIDEMADEAEGYNVVKVDVDKNNELSSKHGVLSIPTLIIFKDGKEVKRFQGLQQKDLLINELKNA